MLEVATLGITAHHPPEALDVSNDFLHFRVKAFTSRLVRASIVVEVLEITASSCSIWVPGLVEVIEAYLVQEDVAGSKVFSADSLGRVVESVHCTPILASPLSKVVLPELFQEGLHLSLLDVAITVAVVLVQDSLVPLVPFGSLLWVIYELHDAIVVVLVLFLPWLFAPVILHIILDPVCKLSELGAFRLARLVWVVCIFESTLSSGHVCIASSRGSLVLLYHLVFKSVLIGFCLA